jgi:hypothetical protein
MGKRMQEWDHEDFMSTLKKKIGNVQRLMRIALS